MSDVGTGHKLKTSKLDGGVQVDATYALEGEGYSVRIIFQSFDYGWGNDVQRDIELRAGEDIVNN